MEVVQMPIADGFVDLIFCTRVIGVEPLLCDLRSFRVGPEKGVVTRGKPFGEDGALGLVTHSVPCGEQERQPRGFFDGQALRGIQCAIASWRNTVLKTNQIP